MLTLLNHNSWTVDEEGSFRKSPDRHPHVSRVNKDRTDSSVSAQGQSFLSGRRQHVGGQFSLWRGLTQLLRNIFTLPPHHLLFPKIVHRFRENIIMPIQFSFSPRNFHFHCEFLTIPVDFSYSPKNFHFHRKFLTFPVEFSYSPRNFRFHREFLTFPVEFSYSPENFHFHRQFLTFTAKFSISPSHLFAPQKRKKHTQCLKILNSIILPFRRESGHIPHVYNSEPGGGHILKLVANKSFFGKNKDLHPP